RIVVEAVHDMIIITDSKGSIKFSNAMFLDEISELTQSDISSEDLFKKNITDYIEYFQDNLDLKSMIKKVSEGQEFDLLTVHFKPELKTECKYFSSIRGIFDENLVLEEIIITMAKN
ncbi:MAG: hypothetical protein ACTSWY_02525, partial [Promethearchaeota archaeon]